MHTLFKIGMIGLLLLICSSLFAQLGKTWPYSANYPYTLKGPVKTWKLTGEKGVLRTLSYSKEGKLLEDNSRNSSGSSSSKQNMPPLVKKELETIVNAADLQGSSLFTYVLNERGQILERKSQNSLLTNLFDEDGNILISKSHSLHTQTRAWNSIHHDELTYTFTDTLTTITILKYNDLGGLIDFQHHDNNMDNSYRIAYERDSANHMIERREYDTIEISYSKDDSATRIAKAAKDETFDIETLIPHFWRQSGTTPTRELFSYDSEGRRIGYTCYCLRTRNVPFDSFKAEWEYDEAGKIIKETQYKRHETYQEFWLDTELFYDAYENIIEEKINYGGRLYVFNYAIEYWK
jgi:hypothetical protein